MTAELAGRLALVTGASGKLGPVWIGALAGAGARVIGVDVRAGEIEGAESVEVADVTDRDSLLALRERLGAVPDVLINNAGIDQPPTGDAGSLAIED
nr:NAD-dependent epimerase/dehydratase family protein [Actinomycetota bacterium]